MNIKKVAPLTTKASYLKNYVERNRLDSSRDLSKTRSKVVSPYERSLEKIKFIPSIILNKTPIKKINNHNIQITQKTTEQPVNEVYKKRIINYKINKKTPDKSNTSSIRYCKTDNSTTMNKSIISTKSKDMSKDKPNYSLKITNKSVERIQLPKNIVYSKKCSQKNIFSNSKGNLLKGASSSNNLNILNNQKTRIIKNDLTTQKSNISNNSNTQFSDNNIKITKKVNYDKESKSAIKYKDIRPVIHNKSKVIKTTNNDIFKEIDSIIHHDQNLDNDIFINEIQLNSQELVSKRETFGYTRNSIEKNIVSDIIKLKQTHNLDEEMFNDIVSEIQSEPLTESKNTLSDKTDISDNNMSILRVFEEHTHKQSLNYNKGNSIKDKLERLKRLKNNHINAYN